MFLIFDKKSLNALCLLGWENIIKWEMKTWCFQSKKEDEK